MSGYELSDFEFVGRACNARYGRTSGRCELPPLHDGDHANVPIRNDGRPIEIFTWHPRKPEPLGRTTEEQ